MSGFLTLLISVRFKFSLILNEMKNAKRKEKSLAKTGKGF